MSTSIAGHHSWGKIVLSWEQIELNRTEQNSTDRPGTKRNNIKELGTCPVLMEGHFNYVWKVRHLFNAEIMVFSGFIFMTLKHYL